MAEHDSKFESTMEKLGELSKKGYDIAKEQIVHSSHVVKVKLDINTLKREKKRALLQLAEEVLSAVKGGELKTDLFKETIANVDDLDAKILAKEEELKHGEKEAEEGNKEAKAPAEDVTETETSEKEPVAKKAEKKKEAKKEE